MDLGINKTMIDRIRSLPPERVTEIKGILENQSILHYLDINSNGYIVIDKTENLENAVKVILFLSDCGINGVSRILDRADMQGVETTLIDRSIIMYRFAKVLSLLDAIGLKATSKVVQFNSKTYRVGIEVPEDLTISERPSDFPTPKEQ